ncbi:MAG: hypothetical protein ACI4RG_02525 [Huintestinicola sp.]
MNRTNKGLTIAREIILIVTFCLTIANVVLMIVQLALGSRESKRCFDINDRDELPF